MTLKKKTNQSPRAERSVSALLDAVGPGDREAFERSLAIAMQQFVEIKKATNSFATLFAAGLEEKDPVRFLAAVQVFRDQASDILGYRDEHLGKVVESRPNEVVAHMIDRMTGGKFTIEASENQFHASSMHKALKDSLREIAEVEIAARADTNPNSKVKRLLADAVGEAQSLDTFPKP